MWGFMDDEFGKALVNVRLLQTERLLTWMLGNLDAGATEAVSCALGAVIDARSIIIGLGFEGSQTEEPRRRDPSLVRRAPSRTRHLPRSLHYRLCYHRNRTHREGRL